jgi:hypothetical protein
VKAPTWAWAREAFIRTTSAIAMLELMAFHYRARSGRIATTG